MDKKKAILILTTTLVLASVGFYFYRKRRADKIYKESVEEITQQYNVFN